MPIYRTKWEETPETWDFEAPDAGDALNGLARETGKLRGLARVSRITVVEAFDTATQKKTLTELREPVNCPSDGRPVWERNHAIPPVAPAAILVSGGTAAMS